MEGFFSDAFRALKSFIAGDAKTPDSHKRKNTAFAGASRVKQLVDELKKTYADPKWVADRVVDGSFKDDGTVSVFSHNGKMIDKPVAAVEKAFIEISRLDATITAAFKSWSTQAAKIYSKIDNIPMSAEGKENLWISVDKELSAWVDKFPKLNYRIDGLPGDPDLHTQVKSDHVLDGRYGGLHWKFTSAPKGTEIRRLSAEEIHQAALLIIQIVQAVEHMGGNEKGSWNFQDVKYNSAFDVQEVYGAVTDKHSMYWIISEGYYQGYFIPDKFRMEYLIVLHEYARRLENWIFRSIRGTEGKKNQVASEAVSDAVPAVALEDVENGKIFKEHEHEIYVLLDDFEQLKGAKSVDRQEQWTLKVAKTDKNGARGNIRIRKITKRPAYGEEATGDTEVQYVYNIKANMADGSRLEVPLPASEDSFKVFQALAENGMIKDRYHFPDEESGLVFEVDMFLDEDGNYHPWAKIDIEVKDINAEIPPLPIVVKDKIMGDSKDPADKERITELYDKYFLTPSPYAAKKA